MYMYGTHSLTHLKNFLQVRGSTFHPKLVIFLVVPVTNQKTERLYTVYMYSRCMLKSVASIVMAIT